MSATSAAPRIRLRAREIYEEGIQIPPMMLYRAGVPNEDLFTLIAENVRKSEEVLGDIHSFIAANALGAERLLAFMDEYGMHDLRALAARGADAAPRRRCATRSAALPDGVYTSEIWNNPLGEPLHYPLKLTVQGDAIELDFEGAPAQLPQGGLNCTLHLHRGARDLSDEVHAQPAGAQQCRLLPAVHREGAGGLDPELHASRPRSTCARASGWYIAPNIFRALADAAPAQVQAATGLPVAINIYGRDGGRPRLCRPFLHGRRAGRARSTATASPALLYPTSAANTSVELMESARAGAGAREVLRHRFRRRRRASRRLRRSARACASWTTMGCRRWRRSIRKASASRRDCTAGCRAARRAAWCSIPTATWCAIAAPASWSR